MLLKQSDHGTLARQWRRSLKNIFSTPAVKTWPLRFLNPEWSESIQNLHAWRHSERRRGQPKREQRRERNQPIKNIPWDCNRLLRSPDGQIRRDRRSISPSKNRAIILMNGGIKTHSLKTHHEAAHDSSLQAKGAEHCWTQSIKIHAKKTFQTIKSPRQSLCKIAWKKIYWHKKAGN